MKPGTVQVAPGLCRVERDSGAVIWIAMANDITLISYSERYAREWLGRERGDDPEAA